MMRAELLDRLDVLLGGRAAEEIVFGDISTGAQDDLRRATDIVRHMVAEYGMSEALGLATLDGSSRGAFLQLPTGGDHAYSDETSRLIDEEIRTMLNAAHDRARKTLLSKRTTLDALAALLIEKEVVDRNALDQLLAAKEVTHAA